MSQVKIWVTKVGKNIYELRVTNCEFRISNYRMQDAGSMISTYPASCIQHPASSILHPASSILYPASCILHPASSICPHSHFQFPVICITFDADHDKTYKTEIPTSTIMPLILGRNRPNGAIGVWQITEDETALSTLASAVEEDEKVVRTFKNESRRKQWYACRALLRQMLSFDEVKVDYDMHGRPSLRGFKGDISFSHTQDYAAVILNKVGRAGIDIEKINPRIHRVADRFLQDEELEHVSRIARNEERGTCHQSPTNSNQQPTTNPQPPILSLIHI